MQCKFVHTMGGGLLKTIGYIVLFYFVIRFLRSIFEPNNNSGGFTKSKNQKTPKKGEFIDYEEVD